MTPDPLGGWWVAVLIVLAAYLCYLPDRDQKVRIRWTWKKPDLYGEALIDAIEKKWLRDAKARDDSQDRATAWNTEPQSEGVARR